MGNLSKKMMMLVGSTQRYYQKVGRLFGSAIVGYWPLWETSGTVAADISGNNRNAAYSNVTLANKVGSTGKPVPLLVPASSSYINLYSAGLAGAFPGQAGTFMCMAQVSAAGVWTDGAQRDIFRAAVDASNVFEIKKSTNNTISVVYLAGGVAKSKNVTISETTPMHIAVTWDLVADQMHVYINGVEQGVVDTGLGTWAGAPTSGAFNLGTYSTGASQLWDGWMSDAILLNRAATAGEVATCASPF